MSYQKKIYTNSILTKVLVILHLIITKMDILNRDINNINLNNNFDEGDPDTIILIKFLACNIKLERCKALKN